jgi:hypothetical protein
MLPLNNPFRRMPRLIKNVQIERNAAFAEATARLAMSVNSIANDPDCNKSAMLTKTFAQFQQHLNELMKRKKDRFGGYPVPDGWMRKNDYDFSVAPADDDEGYNNPDADADDDDDDDEDNDGSHHAGDGGDTGHTGAPTENLERLADAMKGRTTMKSQLMSDVVKEYGITAFCKSARFVGGADARAVNNPKSALAQLQELVDEQRRNNPTLSEAGAFARVYTDPANAELAQRERHENRPFATW